MQINRPKPIRLIPTLSVGILAAVFFAAVIVFAADVKNGDMFSTPPAVETVIDRKKGKYWPKGDPLAGGRPLKTPFGTLHTQYYSDKESEALEFEDFRRAMVEEKARTLRRIIQRFRTRPTGNERKRSPGFMGVCRPNRRMPAKTKNTI